MPGYLRFDETDDLEDLQHYGILGMRWGVRNAETEARYHRGSKEEFEARCIKAGYSKKQAHEMAIGRDALKKVAIGTLAVAGVAAVGVVGYHVVSRYGTKTIKAGKLIQTVHQGPIEERVKGPFYATYKKADNTIYSSQLFGHLNKNSQVTKLAASQNIKIASEARAHKTFQQLVKENPTIQYTEYRYDPWRKYNAPYTRTELFCDYLTRRGIDPEKASKLDIYRKFNYDLVHRSPGADAAHKVFYDSLKKQGFGAVTDSNDAFREAGGWTHNPLIVFGDVKYSIADQKLADIGTFSAKKRFAKAARSSLTRRYMNKPLNQHNEVVYSAGLGASMVGLLGIQSANVEAHQNFIDTYRKEHPRSKLTDQQLRKMYDKQHAGI